MVVSGIGSMVASISSSARFGILSAQVNIKVIIITPTLSFTLYVTFSTTLKTPKLAVFSDKCNHSHIPSKFRWTTYLLNCNLPILTTYTSRQPSVTEDEIYMKSSILSFNYSSARLFPTSGFRLISTLVIASCYLASPAQASEATLPGTLSNADGSATITVSEPHNFASVFLDNDTYTGLFSIDVASQDRGNNADLFMAATVGDVWYQKGERQWQLWNPESEALMPFNRTVLTEQVQMQVIDTQSLGAGKYEIFAGYQISGQAIVIAPQSLKFQVKDAGADTLYPFVSDTAMANFLKQGLQTGSTNPEFLTLTPTAANDGAATEAPSSATRVSTTNLQESAVDEADTVKTDGTNMFTFRSCSKQTCLVTYALNADEAQATELANVQLSATQSAQGMYLVQDRISGPDMLVTIGGQDSSVYWRDIWNWRGNDTNLEFFDASNATDLRSVETLNIEGRLISSRRIGDAIYLVTRYTPFLPEYQPYAFDEEVAAQNEVILETSSLSALLPKITDSQKQIQDLVSSENCYLPTKSLDRNQNPSVITVTVIPLASPTQHKSTCFVGDTETLYMTSDSLYLATTQNHYNFITQDSLVYNPEHTTAVHKFSLESGNINYRGSGQVQGHLGWSEDKKSFRMGENGDYLNIATSLGDTWGASSTTRLTVLKESGVEGELQTVDIIDGIGKPGERLYAARFLGNRAYLVTFRLTDPLYVVDLSDQEKPVIAGELEIEGYSDYLHPINDDLILGIGKDAVFDDSSIDFGGARGAWYQGVKLALFDVSNPANPTEVNSIVLGKRGTDSEVLRDHHALSFLPATASHAARLAIPVRLHDKTPTNDFFDPASPNAYYDSTHSGLYSFEISDSGISQVGILLGTDPDNGFAFGNYSDRSVLLDDSIFYIHQGEVLSSKWGTALEE